MTKLPLDDPTQASISAEDLATVILRYFQDCCRTNLNVAYSMQKLNILTALLGDVESCFVNSEFNQSFGFALDDLQRARYIVNNGISHDAYILTAAGIECDTTKPILELTSADEFLSQIESYAGHLDMVARDYLNESFLAAKSKLWKSSVFMLGAAAERLIYVLAEHISTILVAGAENGTFNGNAQLKTQKDWVVKQIPQLKKQFPNSSRPIHELKDKLDAMFTI